MNHSQTHVIVGATAEQLVAAGHRVKVVTRSGSGPRHAAIELVAADASDQARLTAIADGAQAIYNCANPPYHRWAIDWPPLATSLLGAAEATGARLVTMSNLYMYAAGSSPMRATDPMDPPSKKGAIRAAMWTEALAAHEAGRVRAVEVRASDFFGPGFAENGHFGDRVIPKLLAGKSASFVGPSNTTHSWSYVDDVCATLVTAATDDRALGRVWHVPTVESLTIQELADEISRAAGHGSAKVSQIPPLALKAAGLFSRMVRELDEVRYQFTAPFVLDSSETSAVFGMEPTPLADQIEASIASYRQQSEPIAAAAA